MKKFTLWALLLLSALPAAAQQFPVDTLLKSGPLNRRINLVFLADGYQAAEMPLFVTRATAVLNQLLNQSPFNAYRNYFNAFAVQVPSAQSGATHPRTAPDCNTTPAFQASTYFASTFDQGNIHRLVVATRGAAIGGVLASNLPQYNMTFVLVNSTEYGGSGGQYATSSAAPSATEIAIHEMGHTFAGLADEYWAGPQYARETFNMTQESNPALARWAPWVGTNGVGLYPHTGNATWFKPHQNCKMQLLGVPFCAVCQQTFVERFHTLVRSLQDFAPAAQSLTNPTQALPFSLTLLPPTPNTLRVLWKLNGVVFARNVAQVTVPLSQLPAGARHVVRAEVLDTTALTRAAAHATTHNQVVTWDVARTLATTQIASTRADYEVETYPNPVGDVLHLRYTLPQAAPVEISVLNATGQLVKTVLKPTHQAAGKHEYELRAEELGLRAAGVYTVMLNIDGVRTSRELLKH